MAQVCHAGNICGAEGNHVDIHVEVILTVCPTSPTGLDLWSKTICGLITLKAGIRVDEMGRAGLNKTGCVWGILRAQWETTTEALQASQR